MKTKIVLFVLVVGLLAIVPAAMAAPAHPTAITAPQAQDDFDMNNLLGVFVKLSGVAALVTTLVNAGKQFGLVKDGDAPKWTAGLNALGFGLFIAARIVNFDVAPVDATLGNVANVLIALLALLGQFGVGRILNAGVRGTPLIGYSHSLKRL